MGRFWGLIFIFVGFFGDEVPGAVVNDDGGAGFGETLEPLGVFHRETDATVCNLFAEDGLVFVDPFAFSGCCRMLWKQSPFVIGTW